MHFSNLKGSFLISAMVFFDRLNMAALLSGKSSGDFKGKGSSIFLANFLHVFASYQEIFCRAKRSITCHRQVIVQKCHDQRL